LRLATHADAVAAARGSLAVAAAKAFGSEGAVDAGSQPFGLAGTSATDERWDLHWHWRNARTHSAQEPLDWKYHLASVVGTGPGWAPHSWTQD
jgi:alkylation response protein AidB-like acyl-CoA dehydrogenase